MEEIGVKEARANFSAILDRVESGEQILLARRGRIVARIMPAERPIRKPLPSLKAFRDGIKPRGLPLSQLVSSEREKD